MACVYCIRNKINNKLYFGATSKTFEQRTFKLKNYSGRMKEAIEKYGSGCFEKFPIKENISTEEAFKLEEYFISKYKTNNIEYGYNYTKGNERNNQSVRKPLTDEQKDYIRVRTTEAMNNIKEKMREIYDSPEWRNKNSVDTKNQWINTNLKEKVQEANGYKVKCIETNEIFPSMCSASEKLGISRYIITRQINGKYSENDKYHFIKI